MSTSTSPVIDSSSIELADEANQFRYVQELLGSSEALARNVYNRIGLKSEFLESNAKLASEYSKTVARLVDTRINTVVESVLEAKESIQNATVKRSNEFVAYAKDTTVVKQADSLSNRLIEELEKQVEGMSEYVQEKHSIQLNIPEPAWKTAGQDPTTAQRVQQLIFTIHEIGRLIAESYTSQVQKSSIYRQGKLRLDAVVAITKQNTASLISIAEVLYHTVLLENVCNPLFNTLSVQYMQAKQTVTVTVNNIRKVDVDGLLVLAKDSYESLRQADITSYAKNQLSFVFSREYFAGALSSIQNQIAQLLTDVTAMRANVQTAVLNLYAKSLKEYQRRRAVRLSLKNESSDSDHAPSTDEDNEDQDNQGNSHSEQQSE